MHQHQSNCKRNTLMLYFTSLLFCTLLRNTDAFSPGIVSPTSRNNYQKDLTKSAFPSESSTHAPLTSLNAKKKKKYKGEEARVLRRQVYTWDDWLKHRDPDRFFRNLATTLESGVAENIGKEVAAVMTVATLVVVWNTVFIEGWTDFGGFQHDPYLEQVVNDPERLLLALPTLPLTLTTSFLSLLLVFRTNTAADRWLDARKTWGLILTECRSVIRRGSSWTRITTIETSDEEKDAAIDRLNKSIWAFMRSLMRHISNPADEIDYKLEVRRKLDREWANDLLNAGHRPIRAMFDASLAIQNLPLSYRQKTDIDKSLCVIMDACGAAERVFSAPTPTVYTRYAARFLSAYLLVMPLALYQPFSNWWNHVGMIPVSGVIAFFLFGIEELAAQLEEPFSVLPMIVYVNGVFGAGEDMRQWNKDEA